MLNLKVCASWTRSDGTEVELDRRLLQTLRAVEQHGSISLACKAMGVSYRTLWSQIQHYNLVMGEELIATHGRAGACLTRFGHQIVWMIEQGNVRAAPDLNVAGEQLNSEWLDSNRNKPWVSMMLSDDQALQTVLSRSAVQSALHMSLRWSGSISALSALHRGEVKIAGCHLPTGHHSQQAVHQIMGRWLRGNNLAVVELFDREIGWLNRPSQKRPTLHDIAARRFQLVNRNPSSGAHHHLNAMIAREGLQADQLPGYYHEENTYRAVACTIAAGHGDLGIGTQACAQHYGLDFQPICKERYFLVMHTPDLAFPAIRVLLERLNSSEVLGAITEFPGYEAYRMGRIQSLETFLNELSDNCLKLAIG